MASPAPSTLFVKEMVVNLFESLDAWGCCYERSPQAKLCDIDILRGGTITVTIT